MRRVGLALLTLLLPLTVYAALININTADATLLDTLPGIGPSKAAAIIDYRTQHGPFARIEDIQNVTGIGPSIFADIQALITVGDTGSSTPPVPTDTASTTPVASSSGGGGSAYAPPPTSLFVTIQGPSRAVRNVPLRLTAQAKTKSGALDPSAQIVWSFGDGSSQTGTAIEKIYRYDGTYLVTARANNGATTADDDLVVTVQSALVRVRVDSSEGVTVVNDSTNRLDLSHWQLSADSWLFRLPEGTALLPKSSALFPYAITHLPIVFEALLLYPDGTIAARSVRESVAEDPQPTVPVQLSQATTRSPLVQAVEDTYNATPNIQTYDQAVLAPAVATELAAAGAALPAGSSEPSSSRISSLMLSPWFLGLLGVIVVAGGAFIRI